MKLEGHILLIVLVDGPLGGVAQMLTGSVLSMGKQGSRGVWYEDMSLPSWRLSAQLLRSQRCPITAIIWRLSRPALDRRCTAYFCILFAYIICSVLRICVYYIIAAFMVWLKQPWDHSSRTEQSRAGLRVESNPLPPPPSTSCSPLIKRDTVRMGLWPSVLYMSAMHVRQFRGFR